MAVGHTIKGDPLPDRYHVEIRHPGRENWNHIHPPRWEHTTLLAMARHYAGQVREDEPDADVRIVRTIRSRITTYATGTVRDVDLTSEVVDG